MKQTDAEGNVSDLDMPEPSNVLQYFTAKGDKVSVRPSGTEPKIKFYMEAKLDLANREDYYAVKDAAMAKIEAIRKDLGI
jgi:phosphoglucomutase